METTQTIYIILGGSILLVAVPAILIRIYWDDFIETLNSYAHTEIGVCKDERSETVNAHNDLPKEKILHFHDNNGLSKVRDFFRQDHESLWENRMN